jgi:hypothetical protein
MFQGLKLKKLLIDAEKFSEFDDCVRKVFERMSRLNFKFDKAHKAQIHRFLTLIMHEYVGINALELENDGSLFRLVAKFESMVLRSPWTTPEGILFWLEQKELSDACKKLFGYTSPAGDPQVAEFVQTAFQDTLKDPDLKILKVREAPGPDDVDYNDLPLQVITLPNGDNVGTMLQLVVWQLIGKTRWLASKVQA